MKLLRRQRPARPAPQTVPTSHSPVSPAAAPPASSTVPATDPTVDPDERVALQLHQVSRTYGAGESAVTALRDVDLQLTRGSFTAVMGPSGAGKSTFLQVAAGLDRPSSGRVLLGGTDLGSLREGALTALRRRRIGFIFQSYNLVPTLTVAQNIELPLLFDGRPPTQASIEHIAGLVGLGTLLERLPSQLSGGQRQRVAIARAMITEPEVVFADEPTGALDLRTGRQLLGLLREVVDRTGRTMVMVTHDPVAASFADRVIFLADGRLNGRLEHPTVTGVSERMTELESADA